MSDHPHIYARVPRFGGSWIACTECGEPHRGHETRSTLINERNALLVVKVAAQDDGITNGNVQALGRLRKAIAALPENLK